MICCYCHRTKSEIVGATEHKEKSRNSTTIDVLYKDSQNRLICARCVSMHYAVLECGGNAVVTYQPKRKKYQEAEGIVEFCISEPISLEDKPTTFFK